MPSSKNKSSAARRAETRGGGGSISVSEFKAKCLALMEEVRERGVEYVITKRGKPIAKVVPVGTVALDPFGFLSGTVLEEYDIVSPDHDVWEDSES